MYEPVSTILFPSGYQGGVGEKEIQYKEYGSGYMTSTLIPLSNALFTCSTWSPWACSFFVEAFGFDSHFLKHNPIPVGGRILFLQRGDHLCLFGFGLPFDEEIFFVQLMPFKVHLRHQFLVPTF